MVAPNAGTFVAPACAVDDACAVPIPANVVRGLFCVSTGFGFRKALVLPSVLMPEKPPNPAAGLNADAVLVVAEDDPKANPVLPNLGAVVLVVSDGGGDLAEVEVSEAGGEMADSTADA